MLQGIKTVMLATYLAGDPHGVYNGDNNHQMPSYKSHMFRLVHPMSMSMKRQHATCRSKGIRVRASK
ncbi:hypothetical protein EV1_016852 [Malus domestica]